MKSLKNKSIYMTDIKSNEKEIYYNYNDVKEAVLNFVKDYWSESDDSFNDLIKKHFGDWED